MRFFLRSSCIVIFLSLMFLFSVVSAQTIIDPRPDIYSKLQCCVCKVTFEKCACKEAIEMKAYIDALLDTGVSKDDVFYKVAKKYTPGVFIDEKTKAGVEARLIIEAGVNRPQIAIDPVSFDFGKVNKKQGKISKIFKLHNNGRSDLIITNIRVSCSCVTASLKAGGRKSPDFGISGAGYSGWHETFKPGQSGDLEVVLDLPHPSMGPGKQIRDIFVATNDPVHAELKIAVEAEVVD